MSDYELDDGMRKDLPTVLNINIYVNVCILNELRHHHHESPVWLSASHAQLVASVHGEHWGLTLQAAFTAHQHNVA